MSDLYSKKYSVHLNQFAGPLDLLLHLIKTSEINIYDIPIAEITKQYLEYLSLLVELDLGNLSEFVETAATLILIKSKMMLPVEVDYFDEDEDPREGLVERLLEYQKYKIAAGLLEIREEENVPIIERIVGNQLFETEENEPENWKKLSVLDLLGAFATIVNNRSKDESFKITRYDFTVEEKVNLINEILQESEHFNYFEIISESMSKIELVCSFLAILELVKLERIFVRQHIIFGDIEIVRRNNNSNKNVDGSTI